MKKLAVAAYLLAGICAVNASHEDDKDRLDAVAGQSAVTWDQTDIDGVVKLFISSPGLSKFMQATGNKLFMETIAEKMGSGQVAYTQALGADSLLNKIANSEMPARREGVIQYIQSGMTKYTVAESHPHLPMAIACITDNNTITQLTFREYLTPSDMPEVLTAAITMSALTELRLIDIRNFGKGTMDDVVSAIAETRAQGKLVGLTDLVLSHFAFKTDELQGIAARLAGINVRLSTNADFQSQ